MINIYSSQFKFVVQSLIFAALCFHGLRLHAQTPPLSQNGLILYEANFEGQDELYVIDPITSDTEQLTNFSIDHPGAAIYGFSVSPDDTQIVVLLYETDATDLYLIDRSGTVIERLTDTASIEFNPVWSPDGTQIAFISEGEEINEETDSIYVLDVQTHDMRRINTALIGGKSELSWSPDGSRFLFESVFLGASTYMGYNTFVVKVDGSELQRLSNNASDEVASETHFWWSLDGTHLIFGNYENIDATEADLYRVNVDGSQRQRLIERPGIDIAPQYSPDNTQIAFIHRQDALYLMNADGSGARELMSMPSIISGFDWSPDGSQIVVSAATDYAGNYDLYIVSLDGGDVRRVTYYENESDISIGAWTATWLSQQ